MTSSASTLDAIFKQEFEDSMPDLTFKDRALMAMTPKWPNWVGARPATSGRGWHVPLRYGNTSAVGNYTIASSLASSTNSQVSAWEVDTMSAYTFVNIDNQSIERSNAGDGAVAELKTMEGKSAVEALANRQHRYMFGDGTGAIAQIAGSSVQTTFSTPTLILADPNDAVKFAKGDRLTLAATKSGTERAFGSAGHALIVGGVDRQAGTLTIVTPSGTPVNINDSTDGVVSPANGDYIAFQGDRQASLGLATSSVMVGFQAYVAAPQPLGTPRYANNDSLWTLNRSQDADLLGGSAFDGTNFGIEEALVRGTNVVARNGGALTEIFLNHKHYSDLVSAIGSRGSVNFFEAKTDIPGVGFEGVEIVGAKGTVSVIPDYACPSTLALGCDISLWRIGSVGEMIHIFPGDGLQYLRLSGSDGVQAYWVMYAQFVPLSPRDNCNFLLAA